MHIKVSEKQDKAKEKLSKTDKHLDKQTKRMGEKTQLIKCRDEKGLSDNTEIQRTIREYFENFYSNKLENLKN
jgi:hypothetical protein